jgi:hypothetical protein
VTELRAQINMRFSSDLNFSLSLVELVDTPGEAADAGENAADIVHAWINAYAQRTSENAERDANES